MMITRPIAILAVTLLLTTSALAQLSITPPVATQKEPAKRPAEKAKPRPPAAAAKKTEKTEPKSEAKPEAKSEAKPEPKPSAAPAASATPSPAPDNPNVDVVYGAYQRGEYKTTFGL